MRKIFYTYTLNFELTTEDECTNKEKVKFSTARKEIPTLVRIIRNNTLLNRFF